MQIIPLFPEFSHDVASRIEKAILKTRDGQITADALLEAYSVIIGALFTEVSKNPRVKNIFDTQHSSVTGIKICFYIEKTTPWLLEVVPVPQVLAWSVTKNGAANELPGFAMDWATITAMIAGKSDTEMCYQAIVKRKIRTVNASSSNPAKGIRELFSFIGPVLDRKDVIEAAVKRGAPEINLALNKLGC
ncbi:MAG: hypothetical protein SVY53_01905 [Chloroflexota bacterium]|nr:hypothetical protein [Chloroflexota bacterium]